MERNVQTMLASIGGAVLLLIGIIGLFSDPVLGLFNINGLHNAVHIVSGIAGVGLGIWGGTKAASMFNKVFGSIYLIVAILGFAGVSFVTGMLDLNTADNALHLLLAVVFGGVGFFA